MKFRWLESAEVAFLFRVSAAGFGFLALMLAIGLASVEVFGKGSGGGFVSMLLSILLLAAVSRWFEAEARFRETIILLKGGGIWL